MNSQEQFELERAALALAKTFLLPCVERGDSIESLKASHAGMGCKGNSVSIGGWMDGKSYNTDYVIVRRVDGRDANIAFRLRDIYRDLQRDLKSMEPVEDFKLEPG